jgi:membrane-associated phospholipid phosphatase
MSAATSSDDGRLLPAPIRRPAALLAVCGAVVFLVLAAKYHGADSYGRVDGWVDTHVPQAQPTTSAVAVLAETVPVVFGLIAAAAAITALVARKWRCAALAVAGPALTLLVAELGKPVIDRTIAGGFLALPSGHTAGATSVTLATAIVLLGRFRAHLIRAAVLGLIATTVLGGGMALVMVSLRYHYATDTIAGFGVAIATTIGVAFAIDGVALAIDGVAGRRAGPAARGRPDGAHRLAQRST